MHTTEWDREALQSTLKEIMERAELSQAAIGQIAGRDRTMANRWVTGRSRPTFEAASALAASLSAQHPDLAKRLLDAAGYRAPDHDRSPPQPTSQPTAVLAERVVKELREVARKEEKSIGDILVERGLATAEELTLSEEKRGDRLVNDILASDLPEETKNVLLQDYVNRRRHHFRKEGLIEQPEEK